MLYQIRLMPSVDFSIVFKEFNKCTVSFVLLVIPIHPLSSLVVYLWSVFLRHEAERLEQEARGRLERQKITDQAEAERARKELLELEALR